VSCCAEACMALRDMNRPSIVSGAFFLHVGLCGSDITFP
jgi:hypothetical protein